MASGKLTYTVGTANMFAAFMDESSESDTGELRPFKGQLQTAVKPVCKPTIESVKNGDPQVAKTGPQVSKPAQARAQVENQTKNQVEKQVRAQVENQVIAQDGELLADIEVSKDKRGGIGRKRNLGKIGPVQRQAQRVYDRRSGTGRGKEGKKQGQGGHNWGGQASESSSHPTLDRVPTRERKSLTKRVEPAKFKKPEPLILTPAPDLADAIAFPSLA